MEIYSSRKPFIVSAGRRTPALRPAAWPISRTALLAGLRWLVTSNAWSPRRTSKFTSAAALHCVIARCFEKKSAHSRPQTCVGPFFQRCAAKYSGEILYIADSISISCAVGQLIVASHPIPRNRTSSTQAAQALQASAIASPTPPFYPTPTN
jgi:hypothetical protein